LCSFFRMNFYQFHHSKMSLLGIELHNLFWFVLFGFIKVSWPRSWIWKVNPSWPELIQYVVVSTFLLKNIVLNFLSQTIFVPVIQVVFGLVELIGLYLFNSHFFYLCLKFKLHNFKLFYFWIWIEFLFIELIYMYTYMNITISK
jgi:hypothetical protein